MILFDKELSELIAKEAREMDDSEKFWRLETIAINLSRQLKALASLCHQVRSGDSLEGKEVQGLGYFLEDLSNQAMACVTIISPGKASEAKHEG